MAYAQIKGSEIVEVDAARNVELADDVIVSPASIALWSDEERAAAGILSIMDDAIPAGKDVVSSALVNDAGTIRRQFELVDRSWTFTPAQIIDALERWGVADAVIKSVAPVTLARFYIAAAIPETDERLTGTLSAIGKTIDDLKKDVLAT